MIVYSNVSITVTAAATSALAQAAQGLQPGGLATVADNAAASINAAIFDPYTGYSPRVLEGRNGYPDTVTCLADSSHMCWDAATKKLVFVDGVYSGGNVPSGNSLVSYAEATNSWAAVRKPQSLDFGMAHLFSSNAIDTVRRRLWKPYFQIGSHGVEEFNLDTLAWIRRIPWAGLGYRETNTLAYLSGLGTQGSLVLAWDGYLLRYDIAAGGDWTTMGFAANALAGGYPVFMVAHHSTGDIIFGGTNDGLGTTAQQKTWYKLSANGLTLTRLDDSPMQCNMAESSSPANRAIMCAHPTENAMVVFHSTAGVYKLAFNAASGAQWTRLGDLPAISSPANAALSYTVVAAIPDYGAVGIVQWRAAGQSIFWVYRP